MKGVFTYEPEKIERATEPFCEVGDAAFVIWRDRIYDGKIEERRFFKGGAFEFLFVGEVIKYYDDRDIGKKVFFTREEAEAAMRKEEGA